jgi:S-DNA-T family DNA segregation ATPase FtsK/SpoIIIE
MGNSLLYQPYLDRQADRIEHVLSSLKVPVRIHGGQISEDRVRYHLTPLFGVRTKHVTEVSEAVEDAIGVEGLRIAEIPEGIAVDVPLRQAVTLRLLPLLETMTGLSELTAVVGMTTVGKPLILNLRKASTWNVLISAPSGYGKSELIRTLMMSLALTSQRSQLNLLGIDVGGRELAVLESLPHLLTDLATEPVFAEEVLIWLSEEMDRRMANGIVNPHLIVLIDDLGWFIEVEDRLALEALERIAQWGCEVGVHFIAACQLPLRSALKQLSSCQGLVTVLPVRTETESIASKIGRFRFSVGSDRELVDVAWLSVHDLDNAVRLAVQRWGNAGKQLRTSTESRQ